MNADGNVIKIKHDVLFEVAKLAFAGELEEPPAEAYSGTDPAVPLLYLQRA